MRTVLFTGAGASRGIGYPMTSDLLPLVREELASGELFRNMSTRRKERRDRKDLEASLLTLLPGFQKLPADELPLITDVFSLVEFSLLSNESLPIGGESALRHFRELLKQAITDILLGYFLEDWNLEIKAQKQQKRSLDSLAQWIWQQGKSIGLVTTNYDIGLEYEIYKKMKRKRVYRNVDLGFDYRHIRSGREHTRPAKPMLRVYKLHGSLDTLRCRACGYVYFNPWGSIADLPFQARTTHNNTCHCRNDKCRERLELHIVAPSLVRDVRDANILSVWRSALELMRSAQRWFIIGYSLPPEDLAIRSLFIRAYSAATEKPKITVVQLGNSAKSRYKILFPDCRYEAGGLEKFLDRHSAECL